jgi:uncharacterized membrane protein YfcA
MTLLQEPAVSLIAPIVLGLIIGAVLGGVGGGGAILTVPVLVYLLNQPVADAMSASLVVVGLGAAAGLVGYATSGRVDYRTGITVAAAGLPAGVVGSRISPHIDPQVLMLTFSLLMLLAAVALILPRQAELATPPESRKPPETRKRWHLPPLASTGTVGIAAGFLTGLLGVGGGFMLVPALVIVLALPIDLAAGTSLLIIVCNSAVASLSRIGGPAAHLDLSIVAPFTLAVMIAAWAGRKLAGQLGTTTTTRALAALLIAVAAWGASNTVWSHDPPNTSQAHSHNRPN